MAVAIVVGPGSAGAESSCCHSGFVGDILELAIAQVVIESIAAEAGYVDIGQAVVVVIGDGYAHAPPFANKSGGGSDIAEFEAVVLVIKRDHAVAALFVAVDGGSAHGEDVESAIIVAIDQTGAAAHRFH